MFMKDKFFSKCDLFGKIINILAYQIHPVLYQQVFRNLYSK